MTRSCDRLVFVVDDDTAIRESLADLLIEEGYKVVTAQNGQDALDKLRLAAPGMPCVILLDLMMPVMTGSQFYAEQQKDPALASIPVVVISADGNVGARSRAFGGDYLTKPVRIETVLGAVERHCI
ncbi:MAG: Response regulator receiver protein [bacterium]|nr:Response regulator receiver protein [bacterium]